MQSIYIRTITTSSVQALIVLTPPMTGGLKSHIFPWICQGKITSIPEAKGLQSSLFSSGIVIYNDYDYGKALSELAIKLIGIGE